MREHGRDPEGLFDEPMLQLRNQGQILGEERPGDRLVIAGEWDDGRFVAESVRVDEHAHDDAAPVVGQLVRRTEQTLQVETAGGTVTVEVPESAEVDVPGIDGVNDVTQLRHHLEVQRMSKSKGNVVNPDELVERYGADTVRIYLMFAFDWEKGGPWDSRGIAGARRFVDDVWKIGTTDYEPGGVTVEESPALRRAAHQAIAKVDRDMEAFKWNTAVAALMKLRNELLEARRTRAVSLAAWNEAVDVLLLLLAPIAPHVTEALWHERDNDGSIHVQPWPESDPEVAADQTTTLVIQVNGKVRDRIEVSPDIDDDAAVAAAMGSERIREWLAKCEVRKVIARPPALVNIVCVKDA
jgi:leucyl-tRNA synthetase